MATVTEDDIFGANFQLQAAMRAAEKPEATKQQPVQQPGMVGVRLTSPASTAKSSCAEDYVRAFWPPELAELLHPFRRFVEACVYKLRKNAHKRSYDEADLPELFKLLRGEIDELERAVAEGNSVETLLEGSDVANMAMLIATVAMKRGIK